MACPRCGNPSFGGRCCQSCGFDLWGQPLPNYPEAIMAQHYPEAIMAQQRFIQAQEKARMEQALHSAYASQLNDAIRYATDVVLRGEKKPQKSLLGKHARDKKLLLTRRVACN